MAGRQVPSTWLWATVFVLVPSWGWSQTKDPTDGPTRPLAPGILTVIPTAAEERESFTDPIPLVELLAEAKSLDWTPNFLPKSETLLEKAKEVVIRREIWNLEFAFKPLRRIEVDVPQASGKMQRKNIYYLVYRVRNVGGDLRPKPIKDDTYDHITFGSERIDADSRRFLPHFVLTGKVLIDGQYVAKEYLDRLIPAAQAPIQNREMGGKKLYNSVEICRVGISLSDDQNDRSVWGVATWEDLDPRIDFFSIYVQGLTNAHKFKDTPGAYQPGDPPAKGRQFVYKTLQLNFHRAGDSLLEHEDEIHFGVPLDSNPADQARFLSMYGLKEPLDHLWVYR